MAMSDDEKVEIINEILPEIERFKSKATGFKSVLNNPDAADFVKLRAWKAVQRAGQDLKESLSHATRIERKVAQ